MSKAAGVEDLDLKSGCIYRTELTTGNTKVEILELYNSVGCYLGYTPSENEIVSSLNFYEDMENGGEIKIYHNDKNFPLGQLQIIGQDYQIIDLCTGDYELQFDAPYGGCYLDLPTDNVDGMKSATFGGIYTWTDSI